MFNKKNESQQQIFKSNMTKLDDKKHNGQDTSKSTGTNIKSNLVLKKNSQNYEQRIFSQPQKKGMIAEHYFP